MGDKPMEITRENVCEIHGHDVRWRLVLGPVPERHKRPSVLICLDCHKVFEYVESSPYEH